MYYIHPFWFYFISICNNLNILATVLAVFLGVVIMIILISIGRDIEWTSEEEIKKFLINIKFKTLIIFECIIILLNIFIPSEETCIRMIVANTVTKENVEDTVDFIENIIEEVNNILNDKIE